MTSPLTDIYMQLTECVTRVDEDAITWPHGPSGGWSLQNIWQLDKKQTGQGIPNGQLRWESTLTFLSPTTTILTSRQLCYSNVYSMRPGFKLYTSAEKSFKFQLISLGEIMLIRKLTF